MAAKAAPKKKPVSAKQATAVANMMKSQKQGGNGGNQPAQPTPKTSPMTTDDDQDDAPNQGA